MKGVRILLLLLGFCCLVISQKASSVNGFESFVCNGQEYPSNSNFETSLNYVLAKLQLLTPGTQNFNRYENSPDGVVYGHAVCHYQSTPTDCITCLHGAADRLLEACPKRIGGEEHDVHSKYFFAKSLVFCAIEKHPEVLFGSHLQVFMMDLGEVLQSSSSMVSYFIELEIYPGIASSFAIDVIQKFMSKLLALSLSMQ
nr:antifungal protein ginkbilobin-like protein [Ipomoea batatas]GME14924.1 antifungal protein ginkbilobin-like protein [Ipomoea batatas]